MSELDDEKSAQYLSDVARMLKNHPTERRFFGHVPSTLREIADNLEVEINARERRMDGGVIRAVTEQFIEDIKKQIGNADFMECSVCASKRGMAELCPSCLQNRSLISILKSLL